jgi:SAM-dependent methyltransferase
VGCGTGAAVRMAAPKVEHATGVDLSPAMIARARELAAGLNIARVLDRGLRLFQPSHVGFRRSHELATLLADAGLKPQAPQLLWHGGYVILRAYAFLA